MRFWDSSAILPLLATEATSETLHGLLQEDDEMIVWWGTWVECAVAINRLAREGRLSDEEEARVVFVTLAGNWREIQATDGVRSLAVSLSGRRLLKAADTLQLAAALVWCEEETEGRELVCLDDKLRWAAEDEGFDVLPELPDEEGDP